MNDPIRSNTKLSKRSWNTLVRIILNNAHWQVEFTQRTPQIHCTSPTTMHWFGSITTARHSRHHQPFSKPIPPCCSVLQRIPVKEPDVPVPVSSRETFYVVSHFHRSTIRRIRLIHTARKIDSACNVASKILCSLWVRYSHVATSVPNS